jgi:hypothetical protein
VSDLEFELVVPHVDAAVAESFRQGPNAFTEIFPARPVQFLEWARNAGACASPASPTSADTTATSSGWPQAMVIEVSRRHLMRKPTDDLIEPAHLVFAKQTPAYLARSWHEAQIGLENCR